MWGVIRRSGNHSKVGSENQNNLYRNLLVGNVLWAVVLIPAEYYVRAALFHLKYL